MIVVVGRPALDERGGLVPLAGGVAAAAADYGARVEVVGSVPDDSTGDATITELGRRGIGHAALLRMPPTNERRLETTEPPDETTEPRLDAADIELGLRYVADCRVLVIADVLDAPAAAAAVDGARYHGAKLVLTTAVAAPAGAPSIDLPADATLLAAPDRDDGAFAELIGRYAARLDAGSDAADAWRDAVDATGWEHSAASDGER